VEESIGFFYELSVLFFAGALQAKRMSSEHNFAIQALFA